MLKSIIIVTIAVLNLEPVETAYQEEFGYTTVEQSTVGKDLAGVWDAPHMQGRDYLLMKADSEQEVFLRFVQLPGVQGYKGMTTHGWNATELLVLDPDKMAAQLEDSAFKIIGAPKDLWQAPNAPRAMQVLGPGEEVVYLTRNVDFSTSAAVDRVFIMVLAGPSMTSLANFYGDTLGLEVSDATPFNISAVSNAQGLPAETLYPLAVATISQDFLIELDEYPASIPARPLVDGEIPPGISMVSFAVDNLDELDLTYRAEPAALSQKPYNGRRTAVATGPAGEWLELLETQ
jgi:hypothetical protein